jgi:hypothetical protein
MGTGADSLHACQPDWTQIEQEDIIAVGAHAAFSVRDPVESATKADKGSQDQPVVFGSEVHDFLE